MKRNLDFDQTGFAHLVEVIKKFLQVMGWELENSAWLEDERVKEIKILKGNLEAVQTVAETVTDHSLDFMWRLATREIDLWTNEVLPKLRLNPKYLDVSKLKNIELLSIAGHGFDRIGSGHPGAIPHRITVGGERYEISTTSWTAIPPLDPSDEQNFFANRELFKIRLAIKTKKPVSERERQEKIEKEKLEADANKLQLESELLIGE